MDYVLDPETVDMPTSVCTPEEIVEAVIADKIELPTVEIDLPTNATRLDDATDGLSLTYTWHVQVAKRISPKRHRRKEDTQRPIIRSKDRNRI